MLIQFKVANFQCFRDEVTLDLQPSGKDAQLRGNIWEGNRYDAMKSMAVFGPNASGKTALLRALDVLGRFIRRSATEMNAGDPISGINPFRLSSAQEDRPSEFEVLLELAGIGYRYRVAATRQKVWREVLEHQQSPSRSGWVTLIDRDSKRSQLHLHERIGGLARRRAIKEDTRENSLILSRAAERNVEPVLPLFMWFRKHLHILYGGVGSPPDTLPLTSVAQWAAQDPNLLERLSRIARDADTGILRLGTEATPEGPDGIAIHGMTEPPTAVKEFLSVLRKVLKESPSTAKGSPMEIAERDEDAVRFFTEHGTARAGSVRFGLGEESSGTLRYLHLAGLLLRHCATPGLLAVDELHTSLHPELARRVVQMAHSPDFGRAGAQLLFTTHDTTLLDPDLLRRDQIVLTQKGPDGAAEVYSLWDFKDMPRKDAAWARNYLAGRFGGVPVFGPSLADIPQADEPTPVERADSEPVEAE